MKLLILIAGLAWAVFVTWAILATLHTVFVVENAPTFIHAAILFGAVVTMVPFWDGLVSGYRKARERSCYHAGDTGQS